MRTLAILLAAGACSFTVDGHGASIDARAPTDVGVSDSAIQADAVTITCAPTYGNEHAGSRYRTATEALKMPFDQAATACAADGGRLAVIEDLAEHEHIASLVAGFSDWSWIGLTDRVTEGTRVWVTGTTLQAGDFQVFNGEIDDAAADCYNLSPYPISSDAARWGNYYCDQNKGWICECDFTP